MEKVKNVLSAVFKAVIRFYQVNPSWIWLTVGFFLGLFVGAKLF